MVAQRWPERGPALAQPCLTDGQILAKSWLEIFLANARGRACALKSILRGQLALADLQLANEDRRASAVQQGRAPCT